MLHPAKVATPEAAAIEFPPVHANVAEPGVVNVNVIVFVAPVTVFPPASCTVTTGCGASGAPPTAPPGCVVKANFVPAPTPTTTLPLTPDVNAPSVAVSVYVFATSIAQPTNVATPS